MVAGIGGDEPVGTWHGTWHVGGARQAPPLWSGHQRSRKGAVGSKAAEAGGRQPEERCLWFYLQLETPERRKDKGQPPTHPTQASNAVQREQTGTPPQMFPARHVASPLT